MMNVDIEEVKRRAKELLAKEQFDSEVAKELEKLRKHKPWWRKLFPYVIIIRRV